MSVDIENGNFNSEYFLHTDQTGAKLNDAFELVVKCWKASQPGEMDQDLYPDKPGLNLHNNALIYNALKFVAEDVLQQAIDDGYVPKVQLR